MGLVYFPTFTIKINQNVGEILDPNHGKYTVVNPWILKNRFPPSLLKILKASARRSDRRLSKEKEVWTRGPSMTGGRMVSNKSI